MEILRKMGAMAGAKKCRREFRIPMREGKEPHEKKIGEDDLG